MSIVIPSPDNLSAALALLGVPEKAIRSFQEKPHTDLKGDFTDVLNESPNVLITDWRFHPSDSLREIFLRLYPAGIKAMIEEEEEENLHPKKIFLQVDGIGSRYRVKIPEEPDLNDILFAFQAILPERSRIFALTRFDGTDTYGHIVVTKEIWTRVEELLGSWIGEVFRSQQAKALFKKVGKDVKPKRDFLKKQMKDARQWTVRMKSQFDERYEKALHILEKKLASPHLVDPPGARLGLTKEHIQKELPGWRAFLQSPERLRMLYFDWWGSRNGCEGLFDINEGNLEGWKKVRQSLEFFFWEVSVTIRFSAQQHFGLGDFGNKLALAIILQEWQIADYFSFQMLRHKNFHLNRSPLSRFLLKLYSYRNPAIYDNVNKPEETFGIYGLNLAAWNDPKKLIAGLDIACDYHMMRIGEDHEFSNAPFYFFAAEVLAIYRIRQELGLETPQIEHQLLDAPWRELPDRVPLERDELLEKLHQVISNEVPELLNG